MNNYTILVNSCDSFSDCWNPFFHLLNKYWPNPKPKIYLNTEKKVYSFDEIEIFSTCVQGDANKTLTWSECLIGALEILETPLVLYMQEDYFVESNVDIERINRCVEIMMERPDIKHIGLTHFGSGTPHQRYSAEAGLVSIGKYASYRISTQAGLWRRDALLSYLLPWETGWMFELLGTLRAWRRDETFLTLDTRTTLPAITYQHTGIIKGRWSNFVPELFEREGIKMDFTKRGMFYEEKSQFLRRLDLITSILARPNYVIKSLISH